MEYNDKIEKQFRDKLAKRTIEPTSTAWDRLDAMLTVEEKKEKKNFAWIYIAASLLFFVGIGLFFWNEQENAIQNKNNISNSVVLEDKKETEVKPTDATQTSVAISVENKQNLKQINSKAASLQNNSKLNTNQETIAIQEKNDTEELNLTKSEVVITEVKSEKIKLLEDVNLNVAITSNNKVKVNPNSLLKTVDNELTQEYRETTLDKVNKKIKSISNAVVNRNFE